MNYVDNFFIDLVIELPENRGINEYVIKLEKSKQPLYRSIYSLRLVKLKTLKTYIKTQLKTGFIHPFKSSISTFILLNKKTDGSFHLYINYWGFKNLTILNWYLLPLIEQFLDWLGQAKYFTQLDLISAYH